MIRRAILAFFVFMGTCNGTGDVPSITVYPCELTIANTPLNICCKTENLYGSPIYFFRNSTTNIIGHFKTVKTSSSSNSRIIKYFVGVSVENAVDTWGCGYYGGISTYELTDYKVVTKNSGYLLTKLGSDPTLTWNVSSNDVTILDPTGQSIPSSDWEYIGGSVKLPLRNITSEQNGTYVCMMDNNQTRDALTVVVTYSPTAPLIKASTATFSGSHMTLTFSCETTSPSASPPFYVPQLNVSWIYSKTVDYKISKGVHSLKIEGLNCDLKKSRPIFCSLEEMPGEWSPTSYKYPHELCSLKPPTAAPSPDCITNEQQNKAGTLLGIIFGVLGMFLMICVLVYWFCKRHCCDCEDCYDTLESLGECCCSYMPKCCRKEEVMIEPFFIRDNNRQEDDTENLSRLYNIPELPVVQNQEVPVLCNQEDIDPDHWSSDTSETDENAEHGATGTIDITVAESENGGNKDHRSELVVEIESGLKALSNLVSRRENPVNIRRSHIVDDMLNLYADQDLLRYRLHVKLEGECGSDWGGVSRDVFTTFWNTVIETLFHGQYVHVPHLSLVNMGNENQFINLGRILTHSTAILGFLPVQISKCSLMVMIYNITEVDDEALLSDFLLYVDASDSKLLKDALDNFPALTDEQVSEIQELFIRFDMGCVLKQESFKGHLLKVARNELCIKPRSLCEKMRQGIPDDHFDSFWCHLTVDHIDLLHARLKPTAENVLRVIKPTEPFGNLTRRRRKVYEFFQEFIGNLSEDELQNILQLITGQNCVPKRNIMVDFSDLSGIQRRPLFHTCSYMVELPDSYSSYRDFEKEMKVVMNCSLFKVFTMA